MIEYRDQCVGCPPEMGCLGNSCPNKNVPYHACDHCGVSEDDEKIYEYEGEELCSEHFLDAVHENGIDYDPEFEDAQDVSYRLGIKVVL